MLDCCSPLEVIKQNGITYDEFVCLAQCNGLSVDVKKPLRQVTYNNCKHKKESNSNSSSSDIVEERDFKNGKSLEEFRKDVISACKHDHGPIVICSYSRIEFSQTGDGHFTCIGGYHPKQDLLLVMDVARYKYPPHWVPLEMMYKSIGWMVVRPQPESKPLFFTVNESVTHINKEPDALKSKPEDYNPAPSKVDYDIAKIYYTQLSNALCDHQCQCKDNVKDALECLFLNLPLPITEIFTNYGEKFGLSLSQQDRDIRDNILNGIRHTPIYAVIKDIFNQNGM
ncbi:hypothetical protein RFI_25546 [Reticulomyxa filosa]|uniref:glutathione gamma-glutamylcysteinyltransferase n=1 Tax=Reticulomyxa filosa TaxID=46433 RepID=X6MFL6_RETFI|nr:hypothetical protein RFI_25546 [Reticulomyxa filosa]|eukprot:ETO11830.1 hypothetical protein RFI_25546 [Reticulomyxa filosa]